VEKSVWKRGGTYFLKKLNFFFAKNFFFLHVLDRFNALISKIIFKKYKKISF
jgi:hypothetical protein